jgi:hypothetical protein
MEKNAKKRQKKYFCIACSFSSSNHYDFNRHNSTTKHKNAINAILVPKHDFYKCDNCFKVLKHQSSLSRHLKSCKKTKIPAPFGSKLAPLSDLPKFKCECGKSYKYDRNLSKHKKMCSINIGCKTIAVPNNVEHLLKGILQENKILREKISNLEVGNTINNTTNNYTINMFLNDKCKNAMNLDDFVEKIKFTLEDLQYTSENGYANGISNVFIKNLNDLDVTERPIHCTDHKRLQFYIKDEDVWKKDNENLKISIEQISKKQGSSIINWIQENPNYMNSERKCNEYFRLVNETMKSVDDKNIKNIKKNVGNTVKLEKEDM